MSLGACLRGLCVREAPRRGPTDWSWGLFPRGRAVFRVLVAGGKEAGGLEQLLGFPLDLGA